MSPKVRDRQVFLVNIAYMVVVIALVYVALKHLLGLVLPFILAFCIVSLLHPVIAKLQRKLNIKREIVSIAVMVFIYIFVGLLLFSLILGVFFSVRDIFTQLPRYYETVTAPAIAKGWRNISQFISELPDDWQGQLEIIQSGFSQSVRDMLLGLSQSGISAVSSFTTQIPSFGIAFVFTIVLSFFISMQYDKVVLFIKSQLPDRAKSVLRELKAITGDTILRYLSAYFRLMLVTFSELSVGLLIMRAEFAIPVAAGIAIFDMLPFFGTGAILIPWAIISLIQGNFPFALGLAVIYAIVAVVRSIIEPKIVGDKLGLNPIVSMVAIYLGFRLFGVLGMICMPMITQLTLELHKRGVIHLFREAASKEKNRPTPTAE